jgi:hypothetical protein
MKDKKKKSEILSFRKANGMIRTFCRRMRYIPGEVTVNSMRYSLMQNKSTTLVLSGKDGAKAGKWTLYPSGKIEHEKLKSQG